MAQLNLDIGDPAPWFAAKVGNESRFVAFDELAGPFILLFFFASASRPDIAATLSELDPSAEMFDGKGALFVGVSGDPDDFALNRLPRAEGQMYLLDAIGDSAKRYGLVDGSASLPAVSGIRPTAFLLSPTLQILNVVPFGKSSEFIRRSASLLRDAMAARPNGQTAPVLVVPNVFDRALCRRLIDLYEARGGREIGAIENEGRVLERFDPAFRMRLDYYVDDGEAVQTCKRMLERRLLPIVYRGFQFPTTRIERYLVGCYDAGAGGHFRPHRDNTAPPVAHRRFALSLVLNEEFEGGLIRFPEFGNLTYTAPPGGAVVFSCSLLHEVTPVTAGRRYCFITFLYDEASQKIRDAYAQKRA